jgi:hypothetical protein
VEEVAAFRFKASLAAAALLMKRSDEAAALKKAGEGVTQAGRAMDPRREAAHPSPAF